jgi:hypothetical protein
MRKERPELKLLAIISKFASDQQYAYLTKINYTAEQEDLGGKEKPMDLVCAAIFIILIFATPAAAAAIIEYKDKKENKDD